MVIETSANQFFLVVEAGYEHCWNGVEVKKVRGEWVAKANARVVLVRKLGSRVVLRAAA